MASTNDDGSFKDQVLEKITKFISEGPNEKLKEVMKHLNAKHVVDFLRTVQEDEKKWKTQSLRIAICGSSGQGKSTIINTMRGLKPNSIGAAPTDIVECTTKVEEYVDPKNPNLVYYDLPGVGTPNFPREEYVTKVRDATKDKVEFNQYDFFLIVSASRFTENDAWLARQIATVGRQYYFIRTKIDQDLRNNFDDDPESHNEANVLDRIRKNCFEQLQATQRGSDCVEAMKQSKIFLISGRLVNYTKWDFPKLTTSLLHDYPEIKRSAMIMSLNANCKEIIREKVKLLRKGIWKKALWSATCVLVTMNFKYASACDLSVVESVRSEYKSALGLDDKSLEVTAQTFGISVEEIKKHISATPYAFCVTQECVYPGVSLNDNISCQSTHENKSEEEQMQKMLLVMHGLFLIAGSTSNYYAVCSELNQLLLKMEETAIDVLNFTAKSAKEHIKARLDNAVGAKNELH